MCKGIMKYWEWIFIKTDSKFRVFFQTSFMLLLLLLAKGWAVTRMELTWKPLVFTIWLFYGIVHILLYVWNMVRNIFIGDHSPSIFFPHTFQKSQKSLISRILPIFSQNFDAFFNKKEILI